MERKLASIQKIVNLFPIEGADKIECCTVLGWKCVVKKDEFKPGDLGVYLEIDSIVPIDKPEFAFMSQYKGRVKTVKLKRQVSQGLMFPLANISYADLSSFKEGDDVTELLGIQKWEPIEPGEPGANLGGRHRNFPSFLHKTDETRIQSSKRFLYKHKLKQFFYSEKLDGCSATFYFLAEDLYGCSAGKFGVCSRNLETELDEDKPNAFWEAAKFYDLENKMKSLGLNLCIQCEMVGPGIQSNKYKLTERKLFLFNAYDVGLQKYYNYNETIDVAKKLNVDTVPILGSFILDHTIDQLIELSQGYSVLNNQTLREGIVCRTMVDELDDEIGRTSFKVIQPEFLLKYNG